MVPVGPSQLGRPRDPVGAQPAPRELGLVLTATSRSSGWARCAACPALGGSVLPPLGPSSPISTRLTRKGTSGRFPLPDTHTPTHTLPASRETLGRSTGCMVLLSRQKHCADASLCTHAARSEKAFEGSGNAFVASWKKGPVCGRHNSQQSSPTWSTEGSPEPGESQGSREMWVPAYLHQLMGLPSQPASW